MFSSNAIIAAIAALPAIASAAPAPASAPATFKVKTQVLNGPTALNGLYVEAYHTGAGLNDATLTADKASGIDGVFNQSNLAFTVGGQTYTTALSALNSYRDWETVSINIGDGTPLGATPSTGAQGAFYVNASNHAIWYNTGATADDYQANIDSNSFAGWLACYWSHAGVPQLFWRNTISPAVKPPANCAEVYLNQEF